jgi:hypothetical protein
MLTSSRRLSELVTILSRPPLRATRFAISHRPLHTQLYLQCRTMLQYLNTLAMLSFTELHCSQIQLFERATLDGAKPCQSDTLQLVRTIEKGHDAALPRILSNFFIVKLEG